MTQNKIAESGIKVIGLTGSTGSGKSTVAGILSECGGFVIDADKIAHEILSTNTKVIEEISKEFGKEVLNCGSSGINRKRLGAIVFFNPEKKRKLEEITHKHIINEIKELIAKIKSRQGSYNFIVVDAALLIETGLHKEASEVWIVHASEELRKSRIILRDSLSDLQAESRMRSQEKFEKLRGFADEIIENAGDYAQLERTVKALVNGRIRCI